MKKYYAVRKGTKPGIYGNKEDFYKAISGFSAPTYAIFESFAEAKRYYYTPSKGKKRPKTLQKVDYRGTLGVILEKKNWQ